MCADVTSQRLWKRLVDVARAGDMNLKKKKKSHLKEFNLIYIPHYM